MKLHRFDRPATKCRRKRAYTQYQVAAAERERLLARGEQQLEVYYCPWCWQYHVGHPVKQAGGDDSKQAGGDDNA